MQDHNLSCSCPSHAHPAGVLLTKAGPLGCSWFCFLELVEKCLLFIQPKSCVNPCCWMGGEPGQPGCARG